MLTAFLVAQRPCVCLRAHGLTRLTGIIDPRFVECPLRWLVNVAMIAMAQHLLRLSFAVRGLGLERLKYRTEAWSLRTVRVFSLLSDLYPYTSPGPALLTKRAPLDYSLKADHHTITCLHQQAPAHHVDGPSFRSASASVPNRPSTLVPRPSLSTVQLLHVHMLPRESHRPAQHGNLLVLLHSTLLYSALSSFFSCFLTSVSTQALALSLSVSLRGPDTGHLFARRHGSWFFPPTSCAKSLSHWG